jgi:uncharacterized protein GlcG (DUF336 family)
MGSRHQFIESLENRRLLSHGGHHASSQAAVRDPSEADSLTAADVQTILAQAASQAEPGQAVVVSDREGFILGIWGGSGLDDNRVRSNGRTLNFPKEADTVIQRATSKARTAGLFASNEDAFSTRTARFIIQDHFPHNIKNTPGGPLYAVQFSSFRGSDQLGADQTNFPTLSGDPGGLPIYKDGIAVGGVGVAGDGKDTAARPDLRLLDVPGANPKGKFFNGKEESDFDEAVALAGVRGFEAPKRVQANRIFVDGLRFPYTKNRPARGNPTRTLADLSAAGAGSLRSSAYLQKNTPDIIASPPVNYATTTYAGVPGQLKTRMRFDAATGTLVPVANTVQDQIVDSNDADAGGALLPESQRLTEADVNQIIEQAVQRSINTRALIREPDGVPARVHGAVTDRDGDVLGVFRMQDAPNFGYDVSIQKARSVAFFSDDQHAFTVRALGFVSQLYFPIGITSGTVPGPLFNVQDRLTLAGAEFTGGTLVTGGSSINLAPVVNGQKNPLMDGLNIFPGGAPLYKNGVLVGAIGISGDGVDQDEIIADSGSAGFRAPDNIRSDALAKQDIIDFVLGRLTRITELYDLSADISALGSSSLSFGESPHTDQDIIDFARDRFERGFKDFNLPFLRLPRNPEIDH